MGIIPLAMADMPPTPAAPAKGKKEVRPVRALELLVKGHSHPLRNVSDGALACS